MRPRHPNKHIEAAVQYAESLGWRFIKGHGHRWGVCIVLTLNAAAARFPFTRRPAYRRVMQKTSAAASMAVRTGLADGRIAK